MNHPYDHITSNLNRGIDRREANNIEVATAQALDAIVNELFLLRRELAILTEPLKAQAQEQEQRKREQERAEEEERARNAPILPQLEQVGAPPWLLARIRYKIMYFNFDGLDTIELPDLVKLLRHDPGRPLFGQGYYALGLGATRMLRILLLGEPDPHGFARMREPQEHPLYCLIESLPLEVRTKNAMLRDFSEYQRAQSVLWWLSVEDFWAELDKPKGGTLLEIRNFGIGGLRKLEQAIAQIRERA